MYVVKWGDEMRHEDELDFESSHRTKDRCVRLPIITVAVLILLVTAVLLAGCGKNSKTAEQAVLSTELSAESLADTESASEIQESQKEQADAAELLVEDTEDAKDPQRQMAGAMSEGKGASVDVAELLSAEGITELSGKSLGIDVAKYQGTIDWKQVAAAGIEFAMVRVGYRTLETGEICADTNARYNMQEAQANGIKVGAYFFSTATTAEEASEEADWVADYIAQYSITYPVAYNCEEYENPKSRQYSMTQSERTDAAMAFLNRIYERGYTPMFYAAKNELEADAKWDTSRLEQLYKIWMAWYPENLTPMDEGADAYADGYAMWQYTSRGSVPGIPESVDINVAYFAYEGVADAKSDIAPEYVGADVEALMNFTDVNETVTAKEKTNLRDIPSQGSDSTVKLTLSNGETATRTGVSESGWSRVVYGGQIYYAVSSYLTTDLNYRAAGSTAQAADGGDGLKTKFMDINDSVTAKIEVNLRTLPSVTNPDSAVAAVLHNGEVVMRTGINEEYGWSRVEYNGQVLYCISSYLTVTQ